MSFNNTWIEEEHNPIKKVLKRIYYKLHSPIRIEMNNMMSQISKQQEEICRLKTNQQEADQRLNENLISLENEMKTKEIYNGKYREDVAEKLGAISRELTKTHWHIIDEEERRIPESKKVVKCPICGYQGSAERLEKKETDCIFGGGHLIRYVCPECGGIFGPVKFSNQSQQDMADDYVLNYMGFSESNSTNYEIDTFMMLNPNKEGVYLNYGCGVWAETLIQLNDMGYKVYGYEPYATDISNPYIISSKERLSNMRFDGIFSHDLLEHLLNPIEELKFMKTLLKSVSSQMAHATACYNYRFEYTRFHTAFYTGDSINYLCKRAGLKVDNYKDDGAAQNFVCYVFGVTDAHISFLNKMASTEYNDKLVIDKVGETIYGPYLNLEPGEYEIITEIICDSNVKINVNYNKSQNTICKLIVKPGTDRKKIKIDSYAEMVEFVIETKDGHPLQLKEIGFI